MWIIAGVFLVLILFAIFVPKSNVTKAFDEGIKNPYDPRNDPTSSFNDAARQQSDHLF
jgi:hypothetical protein